MPACKVIDYFETQIGNILSFGSKEDYHKEGEKSVKKVWSCCLHTLDKKEVRIPINTEISF